MAKSYVKGASYIFYINTGTYGSPVWAIVAAIEDIDLKQNPDDVSVPERGQATGHLQGENDPEITFRLFEDTGDTNVETIMAAAFSGALVEFAIARAAIAVTGTKYYRLEACILGVDLEAHRGDPAGLPLVAHRHANSSNNLTRNTAP